MGKNRHFVYQLLSIDHMEIKQKCNIQKKNGIMVASIDEDGEDFLVTLILTELDNKFKQYARSVDGNLLIEVGNIDGEHSKCAGYGTNNGSHSDDKRALSKFPSRHFNSTYSDHVQIDSFNSANTVTLRVAKKCFTANKNMGENDWKRTEKDVTTTVQNWAYVIYKVRFRYFWEYGRSSSSVSPWILNSDEILVYCTYRPVASGIIFENDRYLARASYGEYPFTYNSSDESFTSTNHVDYSMSAMKIIPKLRARRITFDVHISSEEEYDILNVRYYGNGDWHNFLSISGDFSDSYTINTDYYIDFVNFDFVKDESESNGEDLVTISNIQIY